MILVGVFVFLEPEVKNTTEQLETLLWGVGMVMGGIAVTAYGVWKETRKRK